MSEGIPARQDMRSSSFRSEEHTSELQSRLQVVCRLLLEKKKFLTGLAHLYNLVPYQRRAAHTGQCGVEVEGGKVSTRDWLLNLHILTSGGLQCTAATLHH